MAEDEAMLALVSRQEAIERGLKTYFTGNPCKQGHKALRYTASTVCKGCNEAWKRGNPDKVKSEARQYRRANRAQHAAYSEKWRKANPERRKAIRAKYHAAHIDEEKAASLEWYYANRDRAAKINAAWYAANKDRKHARTRAWAKCNRPKVQKAFRRWLEAHRDEWRAICSAYRARKRGSGGRHTVAESRAILKAQNHRCANPFCGADLTLVKKQLDHVVALARGGSNDASNLQWLCQSCNSSKRATDMAEWLVTQALRRA